MRRGSAFALVFLVGACSQFGAVYPPRPPATAGEPVSDPAPSRVVTHVTVTADGLHAALEDNVPKRGDGQFTLLHTQRRYAWDRGPVDVAFTNGKLALTAKVHANVDMPVGSLDFPLDLKVIAEPVISAEYKVKLQSTDVKVGSDDRRLVVADRVAGVFDTIQKQLDQKLHEFSYDVRPLLEEAYARVAEPIELPVGDVKACAELKVLGIEAGPTVVADGLEKDLAIVVAPSVTLPCPAAPERPPFPALANVAQVTPGPFTVTVPIAARYVELTKAFQSSLFTDGKYFFSAEYPKLFLRDPEIYESEGQLVVKMHVQGPVHKYGIDADLDGDLFLSGHLAVVDNEVSIPDLEPTIETKNFFLSLKAMLDGQKIRDQARNALRLDLSERLKAVREKISSDLSFGGPDACFKGDIDKIEVTGAHAHGTYVRVYVAVTARAAARIPCQAAAPPPAPPAPPAVSAR